MLKTRTQSPNDDSVVKTLWLAIVDTEEKRAELRRQAGRGSRRQSVDGASRLIEGHVTEGWHEAWGEMVAAGRNGWPTACEARACRMALQGTVRRRGGPLDAIRRRRRRAACHGRGAHGNLAGHPDAEAACADAAPDYEGLGDLHIALAIAAADLDDAIAGPPPSCTPDPRAAPGTRGTAAAP